MLLDIFKKTLLVPYFIIFYILASTFHIDSAGDTVALVNGLEYGLACLSANPIKLPCGEAVVHFPIFQYLVGVPFKLFGVGNKTLVYIFGWMSLVWSFIASAIFWRAGFLSAGKAGGHLSLLILLSGYYVVYISASYNEAASFTLFALLALSIINHWRILSVCFISLACTISKEVAFPFVLYFMLLSFLTIELSAHQKLTLKELIVKFLINYKYAITSVFLGVGINLLFNYFRFGSFGNHSNLDPLLLTPWEYVPYFFKFLFFSPSGGLAYTWFSLCVLLTIPIIFLIRDRWTIWIVSLALLALVFANISLARWFSPFGWSAWGPRLTLPFLGSIGVIAVYLINPYIIKFCNTTSIQKSVVVSIFIVIATSSLPNLTARLSGGDFYNKMFAPTNVALISKISNFTVQSAPSNLYMESSLEMYSRNIIIPTTTNIALRKWPIILLWLVAIFLIIRKALMPTES